jgi:hypothetical protein
MILLRRSASVRIPSGLPSGCQDDNGAHPPLLHQTGCLPNRGLPAATQRLHGHQVADPLAGHERIDVNLVVTGQQIQLVIGGLSYRLEIAGQGKSEVALKGTVRLQEMVYRCFGNEKSDQVFFGRDIEQGLFRP